MAFLRNSWYVAMWSQDLQPGELQPLIILGEPVVFFRRADGRIAALQDRCPHRFAPLSMGRLCEGDRLRCGYHGLEFDATGACVRNPNAEAGIPPRMRAKSYPAFEKHTAIWIWMGEAQADPARIPDFSVIDTSPGALTMDRRCLKVQANYELMTYNILDITHVNTLHAGILGNEDGYQFEIRAEERDDTLYLNRSTAGVRPMRINELMIGKGVPVVDQWSNMRWNAPACILNDTGVCPPGGSIDRGGSGLWGIHFLTPETESSTHYHFSAILRNPVKRSPEEEAEAQREMTELRRVAFYDQDKKMLEAQQRMIDLAGGMDALQPVPLSTDASTMRFKRILDRLIDSERLARSAA
jgi:phenylpropionate dioxygenase-like ring-hydroxylating dioxygenase large terminal subunit